MSKETPFNATMPPNTTLTSRTASRGSCPGASCACVIWSRPARAWGRTSRPALFAGRDDEDYLIPSATRTTLPPDFTFLLVSFLLVSFFDCADCGVVFDCADCGVVFDCADCGAVFMCVACGAVPPRAASMFLTIATRRGPISL